MGIREELCLDFVVKRTIAGMGKLQQLCFKVASAARCTSKVYSSGRTTGNSIDDVCRRTIGIRVQFEQESVLEPTIAGMGKLQQLCFQVASAARSTSKVYSSGRITGNSTDDMCRRTIGIRFQFEQESVLEPTIAGMGMLQQLCCKLAA